MSRTESNITNECFFLVSIAGERPQKIVFELAIDVAPKTCDNFASFCQSKEPSKSYRKTQFHRMIPGFMVQGGDYQNGDGTGGEAFHGGTLVDESFALKHDAPGILSMANKGKNTAGSQFFITLGKAHHLDGKHVGFGRVTEGMKVVHEMAKVETDGNDRPTSMQKITIVDCGAGNGRILDGSSESEEREVKHKKKTSKREKVRRDRHYSSSDDTSSYSIERNKKDRKRRKKSSRKRDEEIASDGNDDDTYDSKERSRKRKKEKRRRRDYSSDESPEERSRDKDNRSKKSAQKEKRHKKKKKKRSRHYSDDSYNSDDSSHHHKKSSKHRKDTKKQTKDTIEPSTKGTTSLGNSFGKFGIVRESDFLNNTKVKRSFEIWMAEVKGIPQGSNLAKWELSDYTKEFVEDFNTATFPHQKFYDYDTWEMEEYNRKKEESQQKPGAHSDEWQYREEMQKKAEVKRNKEFQIVKTMMSKEKIEEMKSQARLKSEMENAYRVGDEKTRLKLQKKLEPEKK